MPYVRAPTSFPPIPKLQRGGQIFFRHPSYDDSNNILFKLYATDTDTGDSHVSEQEAPHRPDLSGLYARFALDACAVIAGNCNDGWLSTWRDPDHARNDRVDAASILHARSYYFHLNREVDTDDKNGCDEQYPIVPTFREWCFPHDRILTHWLQLSSNAESLDSTFTLSNLTTTLKLREGYCCISGNREEL